MERSANEKLMNRRQILYRGKPVSPRLETDALSPFFNYGRGFFETILFEEGKLDLYEEHLERMERTCRDFEVRLDYAEIAVEKILSLLSEENLDDKTARVKIIYAPVSDAARWDTVVVAAPYTRPVNDFKLSVHNEVCDTKLNRYKSLNYSYNLYWKEHYSKKDHSDEVLFLNSQGNVLEGSYTNILFRHEGILHYVGREQNYLQGIMQDEVLRQTKKNGEEIVSMDKGIPVDMLHDADEVLVCNSLLKVKKAAITSPQ